MAAKAHDLDLGGLRLSAGEGRRLELEVPIEPLVLGGERYTAAGPDRGTGAVPVVLDVSRMVGGGYALRLSFAVGVQGPCMRCLERAEPVVEVLSREVDRPGAGEELQSPYVHDEILDVAAWARDALALAAPLKVLCREDCAGLCPVCAANLNRAAPDHHHEPARDRRWEKLRELKLE
jgi:uncharacterized protein